MEMVIYSACICTKAGKILLARQFVPISKIKIEEHISRLPKHIGSSQQHTQIEIENLRYLYIPMQELLLVVISNRMSNVIEDMEILKLLYGIVIEKCKKGGVSEESVLETAFDLILAFDDVVTLGYRESVSVAQVLEYLEMDSSEEKMFVKQQKMRESEAKEFAKRQLQEIDKKNRLKAKESVLPFTLLEKKTKPAPTPLRARRCCRHRRTRWRRRRRSTSAGCVERTVELTRRLRPRKWARE